MTDGQVLATTRRQLSHLFISISYSFLNIFHYFMSNLIPQPGRRSHGMDIIKEAYLIRVLRHSVLTIMHKCENTTFCSLFIMISRGFSLPFSLTVNYSPEEYFGEGIMTHSKQTNFQHSSANNVLLHSLHMFLSYHETS